jgi:hypothetical protein
MDRVPRKTIGSWAFMQAASQERKTIDVPSTLIARADEVLE